MIIKKGIKWFLLGILLLAACSPASGDISGSSTSGGASLQSEQATSPSALEEEALASEASAQPVPEEVAADPAPADPETPASPAVEAKPIATDFHPTDPGAVQLGDGKPKLVEFFAFW